METETSAKINSPRWKIELKNALKSTKDLINEANYLKFKEAYLFESLNISSYPIFIPKKLFHEILRQGKNSILWKQFIPNKDENNFQIQFDGLIDPIGDLKNHVTSQLIHRYKNRVLFLPTPACPVQCRYCFRKNELHDSQNQNELFTPNLKNTINYLNEHKEIEELIFTGGDPFILNDHIINFYLDEFSKISHLKFIRFHTRFPSIIPSRFDSSLFNLLNHHSSRFLISIMIHTNSVGEWYSDQHQKLLSKIKSSSLNFGSQSVLLKDHTLDDLINLFKFLGIYNIRPYYLHQMDKTKGAMHFYMHEDKGVELYRQLRQHVPGWLIPHFVVDSPKDNQKRLVLDQN